MLHTVHDVLKTLLERNLCVRVMLAETAEPKW